MPPRPSSAAGPVPASSGVPVDHSLRDAEQATVEIHEEIEQVVLDEEQLVIVLQEVVDKYGKTLADTARGTPENIREMTKILREFGWKGSYYEKVTNGRRYIIFKGNPQMREVFRGTRYLANNSKVVSFGLGSQVLRNSVKVNAVVSFIFVTSYNVIETLIRDDKDFVDAAAEVPVDLAKVIITSAATAAAGAAAAAASAPVVVVVGVGIAVGIVVAFGLDYLDAKFEISASLKSWLRRELEAARRQVERNLEPARREYNWCYSNPVACMERMFGGY
ncbi:MAG: hypothetical protein AAFU85_13545 [Planctomycetota bacterium]